MSKERKTQAIALGVMLAIILAFVLIVRATRADANKTTEDDTCNIQIVYTEDTASEATTEQTVWTYHDDPLAPYYELSMDEREWIATLVAGKAVDRTQTCQQAVANVILNEIIDCGEDIGRAARKYGLYDVQTPSDATYEAVDALFERGEVLLDDDVLWFNDSDHASAFHDGLVFVCEIDGISFYRAHSEAAR